MHIATKPIATRANVNISEASNKRDWRCLAWDGSDAQLMSCSLGADPSEPRGKGGGGEPEQQTYQNAGGLTAGGGWLNKHHWSPWCSPTRRSPNTPFILAVAIHCTKPASPLASMNFEFPSRTEKIWLMAVNYVRSWPPHTRGYRSLEEERRPGTNVNFTISIISEICRKIVHRDFELDWVTCVFTIECR